MMRVRFATGLVVQYNNAMRVHTSDGFHTLYADYKERDFVARVPFDCIVENVSPCAVYHDPPLPAPAKRRATK